MKFCWHLNSTSITHRWNVYKFASSLGRKLLIWARRKNQFWKAPIVHCVFPLGLSRLFTLWSVSEWDHPWADQSQLFTVFSSSAATSQLKARWKPRFVRAFSARAECVRQINHRADDNLGKAHHTHKHYFTSYNIKAFLWLRRKIFEKRHTLFLSPLHIALAADCDKITLAGMARKIMNGDKCDGIFQDSCAPERRPIHDKQPHRQCAFALPALAVVWARGMQKYARASF